MKFNFIGLFLFFPSRRTSAEKISRYLILFITNFSSFQPMGLFKYLYSKNAIKRKIIDIKNDIEEVISHKCPEKFNVIWYGAYEIDPRHLVYWICVQSDRIKELLDRDLLLNEELRKLLKKHNYPAEAQPFVAIGFESQETVDRDSNGNWYHHFK